MTVADEVAAYLGEHCPVIFSIIGAGNMALLDAIARLGKTEVVYVHHEQAAVMSAMAYFRVSGTVSAAIVTTGAGSSNALTGILSAYMDSIPVVVIAGNEASSRPYIGRACGVQGYASADVATPITKWAVKAWTPANIHYYLSRAFGDAVAGRPGPTWIELPMDVAGSEAA